MTWSRSIFPHFCAAVVMLFLPQFVSAQDIAPGTTLWLNGNNSVGNSNYFTGGFTCYGMLRMESQNAGYETDLTITNGMLTNDVIGMVNVNQGSGGGRVIYGSVLNNGSFNANYNLTISQANGSVFNSGAFNVASGWTVAMSGQNQSFTQNAGTLAINGALNLSGMQFNFLGGALTGNPTYLVNDAINIGPNGTNSASFVATGSGTTLAGNLSPGQTLWIRGDNSGGDTAVTAANGFANAGVLRLESVNGGYASSLTVTNGALTNLAGGVINVNPGNGGPRVIKGNLVNSGTLNANYGLSLSQPNGVYENDGSFNIAPGQTLTINGQNQIFNQNLGTLAVNGGLSINSMQFNYNGGSITGNAPYLVNSALTIAPNATNPMNCVVTGSGSRLTGDIWPNQTIWIRGDNTGSHTTVIATNGFNNSGTIQLESIQGGFECSLAVTNGPLVNTSTGVLTVNPGNGGPRNLYGSFINFGTVNANYGFGISKATGSIENDGTFTIASGQTGTIAVQSFDQNGTLNDYGNLNLSSVAFNQNSGTLTISNGLTLSSGQFNENGGTINGQPYLVNSIVNFAPAGTNGGNFILTGSSSTLTGNVSPIQSIWVRGDNTGNHTTITVTNGFLNAGGLRLESIQGGFTCSMNVLNGSLTNAPGATITVNGGNGGTRSLGASLLNQGILNANISLGLGKTGGIHENDGAINIASGQTLSLSGGGQVFNQNNGNLNFAAATLDLTSLTFNYNGGAINGTPYLDGCTLNLGPAASNPASFTMTRSTSTFNGDVKSGQTIWVQGSNRGGDTTISVGNGFDNSGILRLESINGGFVSSLTVTNGVLTNDLPGVINVNGGNGGPRTISANLLNLGALNANVNLTLSRANGAYENDGTITVAGGQTLGLNGQNQIFNQNSGTLDFHTGSFDATSITFNYNGGTINGTPYLDGCSLNLGASALNPASFTMTRSTSKFSGDIKPGQTLWIQGSGRGDHTTISLDNGFVNSGSLRMESINGGYTSSLTITNGALTNALGGVINLNTGNGGPRTISANLINQGTINGNLTMSLSKPNGVYENDGAFNIASGQTLSLNGLNQTFNQNAGTLDFHAAIMDLTSIAFDYNGGTISGTPYMDGCTLNFGASATNPASFTMTRSSSTFTGDIKAGQTVWIQGSGRGDHTTINIANGFSNGGTLRFESINGGYTSALTATNGTLTNAPTGVITFNPGNGGPRTVTANVLNQGTINPNFPGTFVGAFVNQGTVNVPSGQTLTITGFYAQQSGNTILSGGTLSVNSAINFQGGSVSGTGTIAQSVSSSATFSPGTGGVGSLTISGAYTQNNGGTLDIGIGGTNTSTQYDRLNISGTAQVSGKLRVRLVNGFVPDVGATFVVLTSSALTGQFTLFDLPTLVSGQNWKVDYTATTTILSVVSSPSSSVQITGSVLNSHGDPISGVTVFASVDANAFTNPIVNGSFETPTVVGQYTLYTSGSTNITGWTVGGAPSANVAIHGTFVGPAENGVQYLDPTGTTGGGSTSQTFPTTFGTSYVLVFFHGTLTQHGYPSPLGVTIGVNSYSFGETGGSNGNLKWTEEQIPFTATSSSTTVTFTDLTSANSDDNFVDNVQVLPAGYGNVLQAITDTNGNYQITVPSGTWQIGVSGLPALGYNDVTNQSVTVGTTNATANFVASPFSGQYFAVTAQSNPTNAATITGAGAAFPGETTVTLTAIPNNNAPWIFVNWTEDGIVQNTSPTYAFTISRDRNLVANFTLPTYQVSASNNPPSAGTINGTGTFSWGTTNILTAIPGYGYKFNSWAENGIVIATTAQIALVVTNNRSLVANYDEANLIHNVITATTPAGVATVTGAGSYTNGQQVTFSAPAVVTNGPIRYTFVLFTINGGIAATTSSYTKTFSTLDDTNIALVAVYRSQNILPLVQTAYGNISNPVGATSNYVVTVQFDRTMSTTPEPLVTISNSAASLQPSVSTGGTWTSTVFSNDTYHTPPITLVQGMDGTNLVSVSQAQASDGAQLTATNVFDAIVDATFPNVFNEIVGIVNVTTAIINWTTDEPATSQVDYGGNTNYSSTTTPDGQLQIRHAVSISGLTPQTLYHYRVRSRDAAGNETVSTDQIFSTPAAPDLQVTNLSTSGSLVSGTDLNISWSDINTGNGQTFYYWYDRVVVSNSTTAQILLDTAVYYDFNANGPIVGGDARARETTVHLPNGPSGAGTLTITVTANIYQNQFETSAANNTASIQRTATLGSYPDLVVTNLNVSPGSLQSGTQVTVNWGDFNNGAATVSNSLHDHIVVVNQTTAQTLVNTSLIYDATASGAIDAGQTANRQFSFNLPDGFAGTGSLLITITTDNQNEVFEYDIDGSAETNNTTSIAANSTLAAYPDLTVANITAPTTANAGQQIQISWTDMNIGSADATNGWTDQVFLSGDNVIGGDQLLGSFAVSNNLTAGQSNIVTQTVSLPTFASGNQWLVIKMDPANAVFELNKTNNSNIAPQPINIAATLSLSFTRYSFSENAVSPATIGTVSRNGDTSSTLAVTVSNSNPSAASTPTTVTLFPGQSSSSFIANAVATAIVVGTRTADISVSAPGYSGATNTLSVLDTGVPTVTVTLNTNTVGESSLQPVIGTVSRNTPTTSALTVSITTDASRLTAPATVTIPAGASSANFNILPVNNPVPNPTISVSVTASASGYLSVPGLISVVDDNVPTLALLISDSVISENAANPATQGTVSNGIPSTVALTVLLHCDNPLVTVPPLVVIPANQAVTNFPINVVNDNLVHGPTVANISAVVADYLGAPLNQTVTSTNITVIDGNGPVLNVTLANTVITETGSTIATVACNAVLTNDLVVSLSTSDTTAATVPPTVTILAGQTNATFTINGVNPGVPTGNRRVAITANATSFATGLVYLNVTDVNLPDLVPTSMALPASALTTSNVTITYYVSNQGIAPATSPWLDLVYLSSSPSGANPQYLAQFLHTGTLAVGQSYSNDVTFTLPASQGQYYIVVNTDSQKTVNELSYQNNNSISTSFINVAPAYRATVQTPITTAIAGTPIPMTGHAYMSFNTNQPAAGVTVTIRVLVKGTRRVFAVVTDANGDFSFTFFPLANEAGLFQLCADNPGVDTDSVQATFDLYGMQFIDGGISQTLYPGADYSGQLTLQNLGDLPLSGISAVVEGLPSSLTAQLTVSNAIVASSSVALSYTLTAGQVPSLVSVQARIHVTSAEGAVAYLPVNVTIAPKTATLISNPGTLQSAMVRGNRTLVDFDIANVGGAPSGPIQLQLPNAPWMSAVSDTNIPSLNPGQTNRVTLSLAPDTSLALQEYDGSLYFAATDASINVPFKFRAISDGVGDLHLQIKDEYTFYVAGAPLISNALVQLTDPIDGSTITNVVATNGDITFSNVREGSYQLTVSADQHSSYQSPVNIQSGTTAEAAAFLSRQTVTYHWSVVPTTIEDHYNVVLESVFETEVPIPVVTIDNPMLMPLVIDGEDTEMDIQISNHGLIAAQTIQVGVPTDDPDYIYIPLTTNLDTIPAMSTIKIPVIIRQRPGSIRTPKKKTFTGCETLPKIEVRWSVTCGEDHIWHANDAQVVLVPVDHDCGDEIKDYFKDQINKLKENGGNWKDLLSWKDKLCELAGLIAGCLNDECLVSIVNMACGIATEDISTAVNGALHFGNCICPSIPNITIPLPNLPQFGPPPPPPIGTVTIGIGGVGGGGGGPGDPIPVPIFWDYQGCSPGTTISGTHIKREVVFGKKFQPKIPTTSAGSVCAQVRIRIDQKAAIARSAFLGTLEIDNGDPTYNLTGVGVTLDIRDLNGNSANDQFAIKGPSLSGLTAVDGTGVVLAGANGSAQYTFIPTHTAAPTGPTQYKIGGTLQYYEGTTNLVQVPLIPADITVFPDPVLHLIYFQQRDVYGPDPENLSLNLPSEPFDLGLMVTNSGYGPAINFSITSGQPKIIDNQKGLLIDFKIIGTEVGSNAITPSLTANLGQIDRNGVAVCDWELLSSLQGRFIEYEATYKHIDSIGNAQISLIDSIEIHELIHKVLTDRPGDDLVPDYLVNDVPDPDNLPDTVYLSDGSIQPVSVISGASTDGNIGPGHLQVHLTASMTAGWNYLQLPDPGPDFTLYRVVRSDAKELRVTNNVWTTDRSFPSSITGSIRENLLHLFDYNGTGSYTLYYRSTNTTPPMFVQLNQVTPFLQTGPVSNLNVTFSEPVDLTTFNYSSLTLTRNGGANLINIGSGISITLVSNATYAITGLQTLTAADGNYQFTINGANIEDLWGNFAGNVSISTAWSKGNVPPVVQSITPVSPNPRNVPVTTIDVLLSKAINPATFDYHALTLTLNGGANLANNSVTVTQLSSNSFRISGLGPLTGVEGNYVLSVDATAVQDTSDTAGFGSQSVSWKMITTPPHIVALEQLATNPRNIVVQSLNVTFSEPIDPTTFDYHDITLTLNGGPNLITSAVTVSPVDSTTWQIRNFNWVIGYPGSYTITVNAAGISDLGGNAGIGSANETWQMVTSAPASPTNLVISPDLGLSSTDGLTSTNSITLSGTVGTTNLTVRIFDDTTASDLGTADVTNTNFTAALAFNAPGQHHLRVTATDEAANVSPASFFDLFLDFVAPSATADQVSNPHHSAVTNINVTFSKPILTNTIAATNFALVFNDTNSITPTLTFISSNQFTLNGLSSFTAPLGVYQLRINQNGITDRAGNINTTIATMTWTNGTTNVPPFLDIITNQTVAPEIPVYLETTASDANGDTLAFSLDSGAPTGAQIDPLTGAFFWKPTRAQASTTNLITVRVTDNGNPPMSTRQSFTVIVLDYLEVFTGFTNLYAGQSGSLPINIASSDGVTNLRFTILWPSNRLSNAAFAAAAPQISSSSLQDQGTNVVIDLQTGVGQVLQGGQQIGTLSFSTAPGQTTAYITLPQINIAAAKPNGVAYSNYVRSPGAIIVVQDQPYVLPGLGTNAGRNLTVFGNVGATYELQYSTNTFPPNTWYPAFSFTQTNSIVPVNVDSTDPFIIYRLLQP